MITSVRVDTERWERKAGLISKNAKFGYYLFELDGKLACYIHLTHEPYAGTVIHYQDQFGTDNPIASFNRDIPMPEQNREEHIERLLKLSILQSPEHQNPFCR